MTELKNCPFCGGEAELVETMGSQAAAFSLYFRVTCAECGVHQDQWDERKAEAVAAWNTRSTPDELTEAKATIERLVGAGREIADKVWVLRCNSKDSQDRQAAEKAIAQWEETIRAAKEQQ